MKDGPYSSLSEYIKKDSVENSTAFIMKKIQRKKLLTWSNLINDFL